MNKTEYDKEDLIRYLLGTLPEAETERFDELSFTSDDFAHDLEAVENELIDAFARGEMTGEKLEKFRSNYLATPMRRRKVEFAQTLQGLAVPAGEPRPVDQTGFISAVRKFFWGSGLRVGLSAAAVLLLLITGIWLMANRRNAIEQVALQPTLAATPVVDPIAPTPTIGRDEDREPSANAPPTPAPTTRPTATPTAPVLATLVLTPTMRGGGSLPTLEIARETTQVMVRLLLEADDFKQYRVTLADESGRSVWNGGTRKAQTAGGESSISVRVPAGLIKPRVHTFTVSGVNEDGTEQIGSYSFKAVDR